MSLSPRDAEALARDDTMYHCERRRLQNREAQRRFRRKKADDREAESRVLSASSSLHTPRLPTAAISGMSDWKDRSDRPTLESSSTFPTHAHQAPGQITGIMGQHTPTATPKRLAPQNAGSLVNNAEFNLFGNGAITGSDTIELSSLPGCLADGDLLATRLEDLDVYATPPLTLSPNLLTSHSLNSALAGIDGIGNSSYDAIYRPRLHGNNTFNGTDDFLNDDFIFVPQDSFLDTFGNLPPHLQSPLQHPYQPMPVTPVSKSAMRNRPVSQVVLSKTDGQPQGPTRAKSESNIVQIQSNSKRSKDEDEDGDDEDGDDEDGDDEDGDDEDGDDEAGDDEDGDDEDGDDEDGDDGGYSEDEHGSDGGRPLLHIPVENGHEGIVRILLDNGADLDQQDSSRGFTALHIAISQKHEAVLQLLIESGATLDIKDNLGRTPLHLATEIGNEAGVRILLAHGADLNIKVGGKNKKSSLK